MKSNRKISINNYTFPYRDDDYYLDQQTRHSKIKHSVNCFFCNRLIENNKYDIYTPLEMERTFKLGVSKDAYICAVCQNEIEFKLDELEIQGKILKESDEEFIQETDY